MASPNLKDLDLASRAGLFLEDEMASVLKASCAAACALHQICVEVVAEVTPRIPLLVLHRLGSPISQLQLHN